MEQTGVQVQCNTEGPNGVQPNYYTFVEMAPDNETIKGGVSPGDTITASVYYDRSTGKYQLEVSDNNDSAANFNVHGACPSGHTCDNNSAEVIAEDPAGGPADHRYLADFGTVNFSDAAVGSLDGTNGTLDASSRWDAYKVTMEHPGSTVMVQASGRTDGGTGFSATYKTDG